MSAIDTNNLHWHGFKHTYILLSIPEHIHMNIVDWQRENKYGNKTFSGIYDDLYIFATNSDHIAMHFKLTWTSILVEPFVEFKEMVGEFKEDGYVCNLIGSR